MTTVSEITLTAKAFMSTITMRTMVTQMAGDVSSDQYAKKPQIAETENNA
jgi:hypothetical protein